MERVTNISLEHHKQHVSTYKKLLSSVVTKLDLLKSLTLLSPAHNKYLLTVQNMDNMLYTVRSSAAFDIDELHLGKAIAYNEAVLWINANNNYSFRFINCDVQGFYQKKKDEIRDHGKVIFAHSLIDYQDLLQMATDHHRYPYNKDEKFPNLADHGICTLSHLSPCEQSDIHKKHLPLL